MVKIYSPVGLSRCNRTSWLLVKLKQNFGGSYYFILFDFIKYLQQLQLIKKNLVEIYFFCPLAMAAKSAAFWPTSMTSNAAFFKYLKVSSDFFFCEGEVKLDRSQITISVSQPACECCKLIVRMMKANKKIWLKFILSNI